MDDLLDASRPERLKQLRKIPAGGIQKIVEILLPKTLSKSQREKRSV